MVFDVRTVIWFLDFLTFVVLLYSLWLIAEIALARGIWPNRILKCHERKVASSLTEISAEISILTM